IFTAALGLMGLSGLGLVRRQLREMKEARKQTDSLIKRAIEQSSALTDSAEQTDRLIEQAIQQSNTAAEQARAANMAACAAKPSAESFGQIAGTSAQSLQFAQRQCAWSSERGSLSPRRASASCRWGSRWASLLASRIPEERRQKMCRLQAALRFCPRARCRSPIWKRPRVAELFRPTGLCL